MRLSSCHLFIYSLQVLAAVSPVMVIPKVAAFAEDQDPLPFNDDQTKGTQVGDVYEVNISSTYDKSDIKPVTSENGKSDTYILTYQNASYISVHFRQFDLPSSCSLAITTDDNGEEEEEEQPYTLTGQGKFDLGTFWAHHVNGDTMKLSLSCDDEEEKEFALFEIDQFAAGFPLNNNPELHPNERHLRSRRTKKERSVGENKIPSFLKAIDEERKLFICGADDKRNAICYKDSEPTIYNKAKAVARLLINGNSACTGWLVSGESLLFTNEHCIDSLLDVQNTDFEFMGEESKCAIGSSDGSWFSSRNEDGIYDGTALLQKSATWDYALIQLSRDPASKYGYLELDDRKAGVNEQIYIPQHPRGRPKEIGVFDSNHNGTCRVEGYRPGCAPEDMTYSCDTEGGSSGSPVLSRTNNKVIALHHCGGGCNGNLGAPIYKFYNEIRELISNNTSRPRPVLTDYGFAAHLNHSPLQLCEGDCDKDSQCADGLICFQRDGFTPVPGCLGSGKRNRDYCTKMPTFRTPNKYEYMPAVEFSSLNSSGHVLFLVRATNDAHIALGVDTQHNGEHYEIVLGGWTNTYSVIRGVKQSNSIASYSGPVLNATGFVLFGIAWDDNMLKVYRSSDHSRTNLREIMKFDDRSNSDFNYEIKHMMISTGWGSTGDWNITSYG